MTVEEIRKKYPNPVSGSTQKASESEYCVLGAACMFALGEGELIPRFPGGATAKTWLHIGAGMAWEIADLNDTGNFEAAWSLLDAALKAKEAR